MTRWRPEALAVAYDDALLGWQLGDVAAAAKIRRPGEPKGDGPSRAR